MNTYEEEEATQYQISDDEATQFEDTTSTQDDETTAPSDNGEVEVKSAKSETWKHVAAGAGTGLLIGGISTIVMGMKLPPKDDTDEPGNKDDDNHRDELSHPEWVDDKVAVAVSVNDNMTFGEAFAAARAEVGPGGVFEWHGKLYGTYTAEEWNSMTAEQKAEYSDHFSWNHIDRSDSHVAQHSTIAQQHTTSDATAQNTTNDSDIQVVSVNHNENNNLAHNQHQNNNHTTDDEVDVYTADPEIEILGVVHDDETNANIGGMTIDGQDVVLIDVDNDLAFDYLATDANGNNQLDQDEVVDIQGQNMTVNDLNNFGNPTGDLYANNEEGPDYTNDSVYEG